MKKLLALLFVLGTCQLYAQNERFKTGGGRSQNNQEQEQKAPEKKKKKALNERPFRDRLVFGGGLGLSFGNTTQIMLAPQVGYRQTEDFIYGVGFIYNYLNVNEVYNAGTGRWEPIDFESTIYGPNLFADYFLFDQGFVGAQLEILNFDSYGLNSNSGNFEVNNIWGTVLWLEGGYLTRLGGNSFAQIGVRVNLLHGANSPYGNWWLPMISFFF